VDHLLQSVLSMARAKLSRMRVVRERHVGLRSTPSARNLEMTEHRKSGSLADDPYLSHAT
jgi:hypothetical protein